MSGIQARLRIEWDSRLVGSGKMMTESSRLREYEGGSDLKEKRRRR